MNADNSGGGPVMVTPAGRILGDLGELAGEFANRQQDAIVDGRYRVVTVGSPRDFADDRRLGSDPLRNQALIAAATSLDAIVASGGACAPAGVRYEQTFISTDARPVRDTAMVRFGADRGALQVMPAPTIADITTGHSGAIDVWTSDNDLSPDDPATKPCMTVLCPEPETTSLDAVTRCLEFGNFRARFFPEQVRTYMDLTVAAHSRFAEDRLIVAMESGSTQVTSGQLLGATRDVLATLDRAAAALRTRHRTPLGFPLRLVAPAWLQNMVRSDLAREMPGSSAERLAVADAEIARFLSVRNIVPTWSLDYGSTAWASQGDGPLVGWPSVVSVLLYPEGSWLFLDGGSIDLGIVRDSTLNSTNDYQVFAETLEAAAFVGVESYRLTMDLCPDGVTSAPADISPCDVGS